MKQALPSNFPRLTQLEIAKRRLLSSPTLYHMRRNAKLGLDVVHKSKKLLKKTEGPFTVYYQQEADGTYSKLCTRKCSSPKTLMESPRSDDGTFMAVKATEILSRYQAYFKTLKYDSPIYSERAQIRSQTSKEPPLDKPAKLKRRLKRVSSSAATYHKSKTSSLRLSLDHLSDQCLSAKDEVRSSCSRLSSYRSELSGQLKQLTLRIESPQPNLYKEVLHSAYTSKPSLFKPKKSYRR
jgi:hypothetical protein